MKARRLLEALSNQFLLRASHVNKFPDGMTVITIDPGRTVLCDWCSKDFTDSPEIGGLLFQSKATGPSL